MGIAIVLHETAHVMMARRWGGQWRGLRIRWTRIAVVMELTGVPLGPRRLIAAAGPMVDGGFWVGFLIGTLTHGLPPETGRAGLIWFTL